ncbi:hypothetical protein DMN91_005706 [Ooceraea biroi]|uniref:Uncharacterized protein n=1 Tax=Ooceraea biroi TaxID=2015173 RepID=A0A026W8Y1_OOCBI|nr:hypothetical protein X777_07994 [Ooceraea biroi]RLU21333.1 hypothetical protein DMN91_005706 [Ooceraea biroi]
MTSDVSKSNLVRCNMMQEWIQTLQILCNVILSLIGKGGILVSILAAIGFYNELKLLDHYQNVIVNVFLAYSVVLTAIGWFGIFTGLRNYDRLLYTVSELNHPLMRKNARDALHLS